MGLRSVRVQQSGKKCSKKLSRRENSRTCQNGKGRFHSGPFFNLFLLFASFLAVAFAGERLFHTLFFARLEIEGVPLYLFNNVFLLHFSLEAAQGVLQRFALLDSNFCQTNAPPISPVGLA